MAKMDGKTALVVGGVVAAIGGAAALRSLLERDPGLDQLRLPAHGSSDDALQREDSDKELSNTPDEINQAGSGEESAQIMRKPSRQDDPESNRGIHSALTPELTLTQEFLVVDEQGIGIPECAVALYFPRSADSKRNESSMIQVAYGVTSEDGHTELKIESAQLSLIALILKRQGKDLDSFPPFLTVATSARGYSEQRLAARFSQGAFPLSAPLRITLTKPSLADGLVIDSETGKGIENALVRFGPVVVETDKLGMITNLTESYMQAGQSVPEATDVEALIDAKGYPLCSQTVTLSAPFTIRLHKARESKEIDLVDAVTGAPIPATSVRSIKVSVALKESSDLSPDRSRIRTHTFRFGDRYTAPIECKGNTVFLSELPNTLSGEVSLKADGYSIGKIGTQHLRDTGRGRNVLLLIPHFTFQLEIRRYGSDNDSGIDQTPPLNFFSIDARGTEMRIKVRPKDRSVGPIQHDGNLRFRDLLLQFDSDDFNLGAGFRRLELRQVFDNGAAGYRDTVGNSLTEPVVIFPSTSGGEQPIRLSFQWQ